MAAEHPQCAVIKLKWGVLDINEGRSALICPRTRPLKRSMANGGSILNDAARYDKAGQYGYLKIKQSTDGRSPTTRETQTPCRAGLSCLCDPWPTWSEVEMEMVEGERSRIGRNRRAVDQRKSSARRSPSQMQNQMFHAMQCKRGKRLAVWRVPIKSQQPGRRSNFLCCTRTPAERQRPHAKERAKSLWDPVLVRFKRVYVNPCVKILFSGTYPGRHVRGFNHL